MNKEFLEKLKNAKTDEERKQIIEESKSSLTDEELEQVGGGLCWLSVNICCQSLDVCK